MLSAQCLVVRRTLALGDVLCSTVVADRLLALGYEVTFQAHAAAHCMLRYHPLLTHITEPKFHPDVDLDGAYERDPARRGKHFHQMFIDTANTQLSNHGIHIGSPHNAKPRLVMPILKKEAIKNHFRQYRRPWVFICPRSESYATRQVPDGIWHEAAKGMIGTKFWLGRHPAPPGIVDLKVQHFDMVLEAISVADLVVSVDTGPLHVAAAFGIPAVAINQSSSPELHLSDQCDYVGVSPNLDCLNCQQNVCPINSHVPPCQHVEPGLISSWVNAKLRPMTHDGVSAIVAVYQPDPGTLNRCLESLLPQVDEIIVTAEANSKVPAEALKHEKIKYVRKNLSGIGYGRNANFGVRHSTHKWLLLLNDDVFLDPQAVQRMREVFRPDTGMVANLLRYPEGTIYHAGKRRSPGVKGWGHIDHRQKDCTTKDPTEMENVCMACCMVRREVFYQINGFDEDYFIYAEDDDFCLRLRRAGWKIIFTPHSSGIHMEHQSTRKLGDIAAAVQKANAIFGRKWGEYLEVNANRIPGTFDY